jgi:ketosteroid isomerase-like protein
MDASDNKQIIKEAFDGLAKADPTAFVEAMSDDLTWIIEGQCERSSASITGPFTSDRCSLTPASTGGG